MLLGYPRFRKNTSACKPASRKRAKLPVTGARVQPAIGDDQRSSLADALQRFGHQRDAAGSELDAGGKVVLVDRQNMLRVVNGRDCAARAPS